jgi:hypothetical protein
MNFPKRHKTGRIRIQATIKYILQYHEIITPAEAAELVHYEFTTIQAANALLRLMVIGSVIPIGGIGAGREYISSHTWKTMALRT